MGDTKNAKESSNKPKKENEKKPEKELKESKSFSEDRLEELKKSLEKKTSAFFDVDGFLNFIRQTLHSIVFLLVYFYFGVNFSLLSKSTKLNRGGLKGQNLDDAPYIGNFTECKEPDIDISEPLSKWSFPYKNSVICSKEANLSRPLYFRFVTWSVSVLAFSYSTGRKALNKFFTLTDEGTTILFGPIITFLIIMFTPILSSLSSHAGIFMNYEKMLPVDYTSFWFPFTTFLLFLWGLFSYPLLIVVMQLVSIIYYTLFHMTFNKVDILEDGVKKTTTGMFSILKRVLSNKLFFLFVLITTAQNAYSNLGFFFASPIIGWLMYYAYTNYISDFLNEAV
jgi:hypothetical protein